MATKIVKGDHFFAIFHLFPPFLELASVKYLETRQSCENNFGQFFNLKKWKIYLEDS